MFVDKQMMDKAGVYLMQNRSFLFMSTVLQLPSNYYYSLVHCVDGELTACVQFTVALG